MVPLHQALVDEGFLNFVAAAPEGWLFVGDKPAKEGATRTLQEMRAAELASWVRSNLALDENVSPNHAWRHTWITVAEGAGIQPRLSNRITGHNMSDVSGRYVGRPIVLLAAEMAKFPATPSDAGLDHGTCAIAAMPIGNHVDGRQRRRQELAVGLLRSRPLQANGSARQISIRIGSEGARAAG